MGALFKKYCNFVNMFWLLGFILFGCFNALYTAHNVHTGKLPNFGNYWLFYKSYYHLVNHLDIYHFFVEDNADVFKYSPTFALFMGLFAYFPQSIGLLLWDVFNALVLGFAVLSIPHVNKRALFVLYIIISAYSSFQSCQTNPLIAALAVFFVNCMLSSRLNMAAFTMALSACIKIYGCFPLVLLVFFPQQKYRVAIRFTLFLIILCLLPSGVVGWKHLYFLYHSWGIVLSNDSKLLGLSMMQFMTFILNIKLVNSIFYELILLCAIVGYIIYLSRIARIKAILLSQIIYKVLSIVLIFMVIFNHKAEQQTYIIAYVGVAIWFFTNIKNSIFNKLLILTIFIFSLLTATRLSSLVLKNFIFASAIQAFLCFIVMIIICIETNKKILYEI